MKATLPQCLFQDYRISTSTRRTSNSAQKHTVITGLGQSCLSYGMVCTVIASNRIWDRFGWIRFKDEHAFHWLFMTENAYFLHLRSVPNATRWTCRSPLTILIQVGENSSIGSSGTICFLNYSITVLVVDRCSPVTCSAISQHFFLSWDAISSNSYDVAGISLLKNPSRSKKANTNCGHFRMISGTVILFLSSNGGKVDFSTCFQT